MYEPKHGAFQLAGGVLLKMIKFFVHKKLQKPYKRK